MTDPVGKIREHMNEIFKGIDVIGLTLVGIAGLIKGIWATSGYEAALCLVVSLGAFGGITLFRR